MKFYITPEGRYVVDPKSPGYRSIRLATPDWQELSEVTVFDGYPTLLQVTEVSFLTGYLDPVGNRLTPELYERDKGVLLAPRVPDPTDEDELVWPDLDTEFAYRSFVRRWQAVKVQRLEHTSFTPDWVRHRTPTSDLVRTSYYDGDPAKAEAWFDEQSVVVQIIRNVLLAAHFTEGDDKPRKPGTFKLYDFHDRVSVYLPGGMYGYDYGRGARRRGTLEDMEQQVAAITDAVTAGVRARLYAEVTPGSFTDVLLRACTVRSRLEKVDAKRKTYDDLSASRGELDALIRELERIGSEAASGAADSSHKGGAVDGEEGGQQPGEGPEEGGSAAEGQSAEGHGQQPDHEDGEGNPEGAADTGQHGA